MLDTYVVNGLVCQDRRFTVPLDYQQPQQQQLSVFAREVASKSGRENELPYLVFFQGGPGFGASRPTGLDGWIGEACKHYRVLLLDQRGTACSSLVTAQTLAHLTPEQQAAQLAHYRSDNIIRDAETIRSALIGDKKWSILGQSFGGFCVLRYLSASPEAIKQAFITGGIPSLTRPATDVYRKTFKRVLDKNKLFFDTYPQAQSIAHSVAQYLLTTPVTLPDGSPLTVERFQLLGIHLGMAGGHQELYAMLEQAFVEINGVKTLSFVFKQSMLNLLDYDTNPIFAFLHESIYCQAFASNWAAHQVRHQSFANEFNIDEHSQSFNFTGEMIFPWMFEQFSQLKPLAKAAQLLAEKDDWPALYDLHQLANNTVPVAAAVYESDMYVDMAYSNETLQQINGAIAWYSAAHEHNGIKVDGAHIFSTLHKILNP